MFPSKIIDDTLIEKSIKDTEGGFEILDLSWLQLFINCSMSLSLVL